MSERERWIVYPLLFLALGAALRDKLSDRTTTKLIKCQELLVIDEQPLGREVILARIGRSTPTSDGLTDGQFVLNGQMEVLGQDPSNNQLVHPVVTIGRAPFGPKGITGGYVRVDGQIAVNGILNATFYAYQGVPLIPALRGVIPGASIPSELLRAVPHALAPNQPVNVPESVPPSNMPPAPTPSPAPTDTNGGATQPRDPSPAKEQQPPEQSPETK
jgi:hypothetical protein